MGARWDLASENWSSSLQVVILYYGCVGLLISLGKKEGAWLFVSWDLRHLVEGVKPPPPYEGE